jgi:hypothetical protein
MPLRASSTFRAASPQIIPKDPTARGDGIRGRNGPDAAAKHPWPLPVIHHTSETAKLLARFWPRFVATRGPLWERRHVALARGVALRAEYRIRPPPVFFDAAANGSGRNSARKRPGSMKGVGPRSPGATRARLNLLATRSRRVFVT